eukprot:66949_1
MSEGVEMWLEWVAIVVLICFSGLFSGLNLGLMSLDTVGLEIIMASDNEAHVRAATKIKPLRDRGNWLLCTLLLGNVAVNAELSILLADKTSGTVGFIVSTVLIVIFGEIIPQALCSRYALEIGAKTVYIVWPLMFLMAVAAWPVSWVLDKVLGEELGTIYSNKELSKLVDITARHRPDSMSNAAASMLKGALQLNDRLVSDVYTEMRHVYWLSEDELLNFENLTKIFKLGHSRIPIFREINKVNYCIGLLYVKDLILIDPDDNLPISKVLQTFDHHHTPIDVWKYDDLEQCMQLFISKRQHLAFVKDKKGPQPQKGTKLIDMDGGNTECNYVGIVTLEDVIEEILKKELVDEYDIYVANDKLNATTPRLKEINWSNSLFKGHHTERPKDAGNSHSSLKRPINPQMLPVPVKIEADDKKSEGLPELKSPYMIRHSNSFKLLGLNQIKEEGQKKKDDDFQYLQINYKTIQISIKCHKQTKVETVNGIHKGTIQKEIHLDGKKVMEINDDLNDMIQENAVKETIPEECRQ